MRLDSFLTEKLGLSRNRVQFLISESLVLVNGKVQTKSSFDVSGEENIEVLPDLRSEFVSRSAIKLYDFIKNTNLDVREKVCLDIGASTGGFTQVLLQFGAKKVYAVDVGSAQLHEKLRGDARIISLENTDIRDFKLSESVGCITVDVSFISLSRVIDPILSCATTSTEIILLFKPQFEVGRENMRKSGVPKNDECVQRALSHFKKLLIEKDCNIINILPSSLPGEAGNVEYLIRLRRN